jgi:CheY-like chemotaxis protein/glycine cleavage system H lipoate-binding protein
MNKSFDILVVDDEQVIIDAVIKICSSDGYTVDSAGDASEALIKLGRNIYKLIICDIMMPGMDGFEFLVEKQKRNIASEVIMTTGYSTVDNAVKALYTGAIDFMPKPFTADEISNSVLRGMQYIKLMTKFKDPARPKDTIVFVPCPARYYRLGYSSWAAEENSGSVLIGAADLFIKTIENISAIELLKADEEIVQGNPCAQVVDIEERCHPLPAPVSGRIIEVNDNLLHNNSIVEKDPYFEGWFYRIIPQDSGYELKNLTNCSSDRI